MTAMQKLHVFLPQIIGCGLGTAAFMLAAELSGAHEIASAPFWITGAVSAAVTVATTFNKVGNILDVDWPAVGCRDCARLKEENRALLDAIK